MVAEAVVSDPSKSSSAVIEGEQPASLADEIGRRYAGELAAYCQAKREATLAQLAYWRAEDDLATAHARAEAQAIADLTGKTAGGQKLTEYVLKAYVKEALELDRAYCRLRAAFAEARENREIASSALSQARERLTMTKNQIALLAAGSD